MNARGLHSTYGLCFTLEEPSPVVTGCYRLSSCYTKEPSPVVNRPRIVHYAASSISSVMDSSTTFGRDLGPGVIGLYSISSAGVGSGILI